MKSKRYRAILKSKGYKKSGNLYYKRIGDEFDITSLEYEKYWDK